MKKIPTTDGAQILNMPFITECTEFYLEGSHDGHSRSCYTIIDAAVNETGNELILLLENDYNGEEDMAIAFLGVNVGLPTVKMPGDRGIGGSKAPEAYLIKQKHWCEAYNSIDVELDDRCYENYTILTRDEINEV